MDKFADIGWRGMQIGMAILALTLSNAVRADADRVEGRVSCGGNSVGISLRIDGRISDATLESVRGIFEEYHAKIRNVKAGVRCDDDAAREAVPDFSAYGSHFSINSSGGSVYAAMAIGKILREEKA